MLQNTLSYVSVRPIYTLLHYLIMYKMVCTGWAKKTGPFLKVYNFFSYNDIGRRSIYQNGQLFIRGKNDILNAAAFKYSLHKVRETILHCKYQLI